MLLIHKETAEIYELYDARFTPYVIVLSGEHRFFEGISDEFEILGWL